MKPNNETELAEMVAAAKGPLQIIGGGTRDIGAPVDGDRLSAAGLSGVSLYEPGALTLVAGAGTPLEEIETVLAGENQRLAFEPMDHRVLLGTDGTPTIGGVVAANVSGPRRIQVGACRDSALGVRFVDGTGQILKNGGRVMKNVTGYDLVKLMAGSWGTLGVLSEVSLKVQAIPEAEATLVGRGLSARDAIAALSAALGSPFDVSGAAFLTDGGEAYVRVEGLADSVNYRIKRMQAEMCAGWEVLEGEKSAEMWRNIRDVSPLSGSHDAIWRLSVKPTDAPEILQELGDPKAVCDWGGGLIWLAMSEGGDGGAARVRAVVARLGGHATLVRGSDALRRNVDVFQPEAAPLAAISKGLRARFDPRGILNPGLMG
ncbi:glycolate oxidase subunit GlcE [Shimia aestuarii]|uniref:Glycolate oxidase FAD binding subunit n=1 Tax=Shimia aestuarii TaxID=254406 RepID=A0A1I4MG28_9RHOB|nr:glycolate oxidase subunit GlcE [Shimia aestuarii]SFM01983.1 glycolate oxidase FAD binding subunit [Shimia aestuarii]